MSLNKNYILLFFMPLMAVVAKAQTARQDSLDIQTLNEVVVTGQYNPQSIQKSVHNVIVIKREQIDNQAANTLADLLNFNLNLNIIPNAQTGKSTISYFGLDAQYFNILVDNIPLVSDSGLGNNIDLTQINLDTVERIEIVEGAMGVEYGANAVSGVINIITKKTVSNSWDIQAFVQEETVNDEYSWFDEGRHIQAVNIAHNINDKWMARIGFNRNDFTGFKNDNEGENYYTNDGLRGYEWLPKTQITTNALLHYNTNNLKVLYKFDYFNEELYYYDAAVRANIDVASQTSNPSATDKIYTTNRFVNNLNFSGGLNSGANYSADFSYQQQKRDLNTFNYYILTEEKTDETDETYQSSKVFFSKGTINNLVESDFYNFQLGYEGKYIEGYDTQASGSETQQAKTQNQSNIAVFGSTELNIADKFSIRPGLRYEYNSKFDSKLLGAVSARYLLNHGFELRANVGSSYRTPNFEELYYYFVDSNHDVQGNADLTPENGYTAFVNLKKNSRFNDIALTNALKLSYIDVNDKIDLAIVNESPLQYQYINIDGYRLWGLTSENRFQAERWNFNLGATLQGISRILNNEENANDEFLYAFQLNTSATYSISKWQTAVSVLFKYNGEQQTYVASGVDTNGDSVYSKSTTDGYGWMDASIKKSFFNNTLETTLGGRNLLNVINVNTSNTTSGGTHATDSSTLLLGYGRSFYLKLLYKLNI
ncbi:TonB-dependent receptor plug domain-containing protein [Formosa algae]|uniref:Outer membrane receptor for ferrienterochelin and colicins n=1 Tax=Formosa algae TaxID=225843 RepID=A0A9X0YII8_9FLAO|nr:TonB-dependent receptor [Formosa algae]MBP1838468.1 outer membrane receptor for ferrienterochelin and colicins [Formosa algae]MDQ0334603.1 outer membrane receptor for ferrienterochelin and colicins [Formosa algae]OEI79138.1 TonB-dependent receptor [Formosa algae]